MRLAMQNSNTSSIPLVLQAEPSARTEKRRVENHLRGAERRVAAAEPALTAVASQNRALLLDELRRYRKRGRFPHNHVLDGAPTPIFVDGHGTRCAVAHLMEISGQGRLVREIARTRNYQRVHELAQLPAVQAWLAAAGLSLDEAARIQPSYCYYMEAEACFCGEEVAGGVALGTVLESDQGILQVRIERVEGNSNLEVGDIHAAEGDMMPQERVFLTDGPQQEPTDPEANQPLLPLIGSHLEIEGDEVLCTFNSATLGRPVSIDTAMEALLPQTSCIEVLRQDDSGWNERTCEGGIPQPSGCGIARLPGGRDAVGGGELASVALLLALLAHRRRRETGSTG